MSASSVAARWSFRCPVFVSAAGLVVRAMPRLVSSCTCYRIESLRRTTVRYAELRDRFEDALQEAGLFVRETDRRVESIDLADTVRTWKVSLWRAAPPSAEPFHVSAVIGFEWSPVDVARCSCA